MDAASIWDEFDFLKIERSDGVVVGTMNRPSRQNACSVEEHAEFGRFLRAVQRDDDVRAAVVTGAGRSFSIGGDIEQMRGLAGPDVAPPTRLLDDARELVMAHIDLEKPIVAAMNGWAMGSGAIFGLLCDIVVVEHSTRISDGHMRAGIAAGDGGAMLWPMVVGLTQAKRFLLTADELTGEDALKLGLVTELVEDGAALDRAMQIATRLAAGPQLAMTTTKRALNRWLSMAWTMVGEHALVLEGLTMGTQEAADSIQGIIDHGRTAMPPDPGTSP